MLVCGAVASAAQHAIDSDLFLTVHCLHSLTPLLSSFFSTQCVDGINYLFVKKGGIYFVSTTKFNVSPSFVLELLERAARVFKDYCGVLTEESIRKNFILLYELLDEMIVRVGRLGGSRW